MSVLFTLFTKLVRMLILTGVTYEIELESLYCIYVVAASPSWTSVENSLIKEIKKII